MPKKGGLGNGGTVPTAVPGRGRNGGRAIGGYGYRTIPALSWKRHVYAKILEEDQQRYKRQRKLHIIYVCEILDKHLELLLPHITSIRTWQCSMASITG